MLMTRGFWSAIGAPGWRAAAGRMKHAARNPATGGGTLLGTFLGISRSFANEDHTHAYPVSARGSSGARARTARAGRRPDAPRLVDVRAAGCDRGGAAGRGDRA